MPINPEEQYTVEFITARATFYEMIMPILSEVALTDIIEWCIDSDHTDVDEECIHKWYSNYFADTQFNNLLCCPHCGQQQPTVMLKSNQDCEGDPPSSTEMWCVICNFNEKGCGASSGYRITRGKAIEAWNSRR